MYQIERWVPIKGYEGLYSVSSLGRVRREQRVIVNRRGMRQVIPEKVLEPYFRKGKGRQVTLRKGRQIKTHLVHVLYRQHFSDFIKISSTNDYTNDLTNDNGRIRV